MNMEETPTQPTIAELWERLQGYRGSIEKIELLIHPSVLELKSAARMASLAEITRQQLLERAYLVWDADGCCTRFEIYTEQGVPNPKTYLHAIGGTRFDTQETAANYIAAYAFWAWELKQRKSETNGKDN